MGKNFSGPGGLGMFIIIGGNSTSVENKNQDCQHVFYTNP